MPHGADAICALVVPHLHGQIAGGVPLEVPIAWMQAGADETSASCCAPQDAAE